MRNVTSLLEYLVLLVIRSHRSDRLEALLSDELHGSVIGKSSSRGHGRFRKETHRRRPAR